MKRIGTVNVAMLEQGARLLGRIDDAMYQQDVGMQVSSVGAHMRHVLDHYTSFLIGLENGSIDYDDRVRLKTIEVDREAALASINHLIDRLVHLADEHLPESLQVCSTGQRSDEPVESSVERELDFLVIHTVHHYAIIGLLCRLYGVLIEADFGVAPSTLRYRQELEQMAYAP